MSPRDVEVGVELVDGGFGQTEGVLDLLAWDADEPPADEIAEVLEKHTVATVAADAEWFAWADSGHICHLLP